MNINFRQGIVVAQTDNNFLEFVSGKININVDIEKIILTFAYGSHNYLFTEAEQVTGAWGPFPPDQTVYIYWDIDLLTGMRTFGYTNVQPSFGATLPSNPQLDQHFFDYNDQKMKVWSGTQWKEKLRVFGGKISNNAIFIPQSLGSQVNLNSPVEAGYILYDENNVPLRVLDRTGKSYFLTSEDKIHTQQDVYNSYKIDSLLMDGKAVEPIPAYHCVTWKGPKQLGVASYVDYTRPCVGISVEPFGKSEVKKFITKGFLTNYNFWNWSQVPNTPLFVGDTGQITTEVPQKYSLQKIGHIVSNDTIFVDIQEIVLIEEDNVIPSPTPSVTPSPSITPSPTMTATPSPTPAASMTMTPTPTPTRSISVSATITPSPTSSVTPTPSPTPTPSTPPLEGRLLVGGSWTPNGQIFNSKENTALMQLRYTDNSPGGLDGETSNYFYDVINYYSFNGRTGNDSPSAVAIADFGQNRTIFGVQDTGTDFTSFLTGAVPGAAPSLIVIDNDFGEIVSTYISGSLVGTPKTFAAYSDDTLLVGGSFTYTLPDDNTPVYALCRIDLDGNVYNNSAFATIFGENDEINVITIGPDGLIYVGGTFNVNGYKNLLRLNADGTLDTTFTAFDFNSDSYVQDIKVSLDDKIYIGGKFQFSGGAIPIGTLFRLNNDGTLDTTYVPNLPIGGFASGDPIINCILQAQDGNIYIGGYFTGSGGDNILRLASDGTYDSSWYDSIPNRNGVVALYQSSHDGKIYVGAYEMGVYIFRENGIYLLNIPILGIAFGESADSMFIGINMTTQSPSDQYQLIYDQNSSVIDEIDYDGVMGSSIKPFHLFEPSAAGAVYAMCKTVDDYVYFGGASVSFYENDELSRFYRISLNDNNAIDTDFDHTHDQAIYSIHQTTDGKIYVGGSFTIFDGDDPALRGLVRLNPDGSIDTEFSDILKSTYTDLSISEGTIYFIYQTTDGKIYIGGSSLNLTSSIPFPNSNSYPSIFRLNSDGSFDDTFSSSSITSDLFCITQLSDGTILIGVGQSNGDSRSIIALDSSGNEIHPYNDFNIIPIDSSFVQINSIIEGVDGSVYVGGRFSVVDPQSEQQTIANVAKLVLDSADNSISYETVLLPSSAEWNPVVWSMIQASDNNIYVGLWYNGAEALASNSNADNTLYSVPDNYATPLIYRLKSDPLTIDTDYNTQFHTLSSNANVGGESISVILDKYKTVGPPLTPTPTPSVTPTISVSPSITVTPTPTVTNTPSMGSTPTPTPTRSLGYDDIIMATSGLISYWPMNDVTSTTSPDVVGGNAMALFGSAAFTSDSYGNMLSVEEESSGDGGATINSVLLNNNYTLEAWVYIDEFGGYATIFGTPIYGLQFDGGGSLFLYGSSESVQALELTVSPNTYYHVVMTVDNARNVLFYVNGVKYNGSARSSETYNITYMGSDGSQETFHGKIGNPAIYNRVLTPQEITQHYNYGITNYRYHS